MDTLLPDTTLFRSGKAQGGTEVGEGSAIVAVEANLASLDRHGAVEVAIAVEICPAVGDRAGNGEIGGLDGCEGGTGRPGRPAAGNAGRQYCPGQAPHQFIAHDADPRGWWGQEIERTPAIIIYAILTER